MFLPHGYEFATKDRGKDQQTPIRFQNGKRSAIILTDHSLVYI